MSDKKVSYGNRVVVGGKPFREVYIPLAIFEEVMGRKPTSEEVERAKRTQKGDK